MIFASPYISYLSSEFLSWIERALFSQTLLILFRKFTRLILVFKSNTVVFIDVPDALPERDHGIPLAAPGTIDFPKFSDCP